MNHGDFITRKFDNIDIIHFFNTFMKQKISFFVKFKEDELFIPSMTSFYCYSFP